VATTATSESCAGTRSANAQSRPMSALPSSSSSSDASSAIRNLTLTMGQRVPRGNPIAPRTVARGCSSTSSPSAGAVTPVIVRLRTVEP
jgi:hypothetical protein